MGAGRIICGGFCLVCFLQLALSLASGILARKPLEVASLR